MPEHILLPGGVNIRDTIVTTNPAVPEDLPGAHEEDQKSAGSVLLPKGVVVDRHIVTIETQKREEIQILKPTSRDVAEMGIVREGSSKSKDSLYQITQPWNYLKHVAENSGLTGWDSLFDSLTCIEGKVRVISLLSKPASYLKSHTTQVNRVCDFLPEAYAESLRSWITLSTGLLSDRAEDIAENYTQLAAIPAEQAVKWLSWMNTSTDPEVKMRVLDLSRTIMTMLPMDAPVFLERDPASFVENLNVHDPVQRAALDLLRLNPNVFTGKFQEAVNRKARHYIRYMNHRSQVADPLTQEKDLSMDITRKDVASIGEENFRDAVFWISRSVGVASGDLRNSIVRFAKKSSAYEYLSDNTKPEFVLPPDSTFDIGKSFSQFTEHPDSLVTEEFVDFIRTVCTDCRDSPEFTGPVFRRLNLVADAYRYVQETPVIRKSEQVVEAVVSLISEIDPAYLRDDAVWNLLDKLTPSEGQSVDILRIMDESGRLDHLLARKLFISLPPESPFVREQESRLHNVKQLCTGDSEVVLREWDRIRLLAKGIISVFPPAREATPAGNLGMDLEFRPHVAGPEIPDGIEIGRDTASHSPMEARIQANEDALRYSPRWQQRTIQLIEWLRLTKSDPISVHLHIDAPETIKVQMPLYRLLFGDGPADVKNDPYSKLKARGTIEVRSALAAYGEKDREGVGFSELNFFPLADFLLTLGKTSLSLSLSGTQLHERNFTSPEESGFFSVCTITNDPDARAASAILLNGIWGKRLVHRDAGFYGTLLRARESGFIGSIYKTPSDLPGVVTAIEGVLPYIQPSSLSADYIDLLQRLMLSDQGSEVFSADALRLGLRVISMMDPESRAMNINQRFYRDILSLGYTADKYFVSNLIDHMDGLSDVTIQAILKEQENVLEKYAETPQMQLSIRKQFAQLQQKLLSGNPVRLPEYIHTKFRLPVTDVPVKWEYAKFIYKNPDSKKERDFWEKILSDANTHEDLVLSMRMLLKSLSTVREQTARLPEWIEKLNGYFSKHPTESKNRENVRVVVFAILDEIFAKVQNPQDYDAAVHEYVMKVFDSPMTLELPDHIGYYENIIKANLTDSQRFVWAKEFVYKNSVSWETSTGALVYFNKLYSSVMSLRIPLSKKRSFFRYCLENFRETRQKKFSWVFDNTGITNSTLLFIHAKVPGFQMTPEESATLSVLLAEKARDSQEQVPVKGTGEKPDLELEEITRKNAPWKKMT